MSTVSAPAAPYLVLRQIRKTFGKFTALKGIDLSIDAGEFVTFLGPSGCGKTTLLRIIAGLEAQDSGSIVQGGRDISRLPAMKRDYGIVFQSYALFPNLSVADNVGYGLVNQRKPRAEVATRVRELLTLVGLPDSGAKYPGQLSGGQQQRIALARALAMSPGLLLLDEPLSALDAIERLRLRGEIRALQQRLGLTTVMVTHDQEEAMSIADRVVVMEHGAIEQIGTPREIYTSPASSFVAEFVGKINVLPATVEGAGRLRIGTVEVRDAPAAAGASAGDVIRVYLRPEDVIVAPEGRANGASTPGAVTKIEFLGAFCLVTLELPEAGRASVVANLPRQRMDELNVEEGRRLAVTLPGHVLRALA